MMVVWGVLVEIRRLKKTCLGVYTTWATSSPPTALGRVGHMTRVMMLQYTFPEERSWGRSFQMTLWPIIKLVVPKLSIISHFPLIEVGRHPKIFRMFFSHFIRYSRNIIWVTIFCVRSGGIIPIKKIWMTLLICVYQPERTWLISNSRTILQHFSQE